MEMVRSRSGPDGEGVIQMEMERSRWRECDPDGEDAIQM